MSHHVARLSYRDIYEQYRGRNDLGSFRVHAKFPPTEYLDPAERDVDPDSFFAMFAFADWLRLSLLASQGGVWIDATLLLTAPLHLLINQTAQISGLHLEAALLEGYFVAAKPQDDFMKSWRDEMRRIGTMSEQPYDNYLTELKTRGIEPLNGHMTECHWRDESPFHQAAHWVLHRAVDAVNLFVGYTNFYLHPCGEHYWMWYYRICVAFNSLVAADGSDITKTGSRFGIHMVDSVQTVNSIAVSKGWNTTRIVDFLITQSSARIDLERIRGIKLRSKERNQLAELAYCETGSIICRLQALAGASFFE
ncbi:RBCMT, partial [Symbiodinium pilosum]